MEASRALPPAAAQDARRRSLPHAADPAFEQLYRRHAAEIYRYALAVLGNPADAEDVAQTTFLNAYRAFRRGQRPERPHNWLVTIAHNVCRMRWRQAGHRPQEVALENAPEAVAPESEKPDLDEVLRALGRLSFNQRAALVMRELEGRSTKEIAEVLELSQGAVEALLFRARRRLRLERGTLGVIGTVPLPAHLGSAIGIGTGGSAAAGGASLGADLLLKAAAALAICGVTAGTVVARHTVLKHRPASPATVVAQTRGSAAAQAQAHPAVRVHAKRTKTRTKSRATAGRQDSTGQAVGAGGSTAGSAATAPAPPGLPGLPGLPPPPQIPELPVDLPPVPVLPPLPPVPPLPPLPPPPVVPPPPLP